MDGLVTWKNILNALKNSTAMDETFLKSFFYEPAVKYYDFDNNTLFLKCESEFIYDNFNRHIDKIYKTMNDNLNIDNINIKPILNDEDIKKIIQKESYDDNVLAKYTFDSFVTGSSNKFPYAACVSVAEYPAFESPKDAYNPLFLYGGVGLGKTHLMHATANKIKEKYNDCKIIYVSSETFTNELISAIQENKNKEFRNKYRSFDVILIDDIQFLAGKSGTQTELFNTFNELHSNNKQIIISSDRPPKELSELEDRLRSRFAMGLIVDIQQPDFETRVAILKKKCEIDERDISDDIIVLIAKNIKSNIRELEGALNKVYGYSKMMQLPMTYELALDVLKDILQDKEKKELNIDSIKSVVSKEFGIKIDDLTSKAKPKNIAYPRQIAMYLSRELTDMSLPKIGEEFGGRDHTTVMYAYDKIKDDIEKKVDNINIRINKIIEELKG